MVATAVLAYIIAIYYIISVEMVVAWRIFEIAFIVALFIILFIRKDEKGIKWWLLQTAIILLLVAIYLLFRII
ncbi:MAG: hypothetical protein DRN29_03855 [Thermoplasmata archaeon]|nr:MAG: hypothetical protein DRN29_03855 [Thermoplasmata archaeon]